jgi:SAM-dependent methyltransferase
VVGARQARGVKPYYDHELAYRRIADAGGTGWDDLPSFVKPVIGSYDAVDEFLAAPLVSGRAIDFGCGGGQVSMRLARHGYAVTGVDFSPTAVELARSNARSAGIAATFCEGDCLALPFPDASFDLAVDNHVLHCLIGDDRRRFLAEAVRVLRIGGVLFSDTMSREGDFDPPKLGCDPTTFISINGNRYWTSARELDDLLATAGFDIISASARCSEPGVGDGLVRVAVRR